MKQNLQEEINRINELINETTLGQKIKLNHINFVPKYGKIFKDYFYGIADLVNQENYCQNVDFVAKTSVENLKALINHISQDNNMKPNELVERVLELIDSGLTNLVVSYGKSQIPSYNMVPKDNLYAVFEYLESTYGENGKKLISAICKIITKLEQPVVYFCNEGKSGIKKEYCVLPTKPRESTSFSNTTPKPKLDKQGISSEPQTKKTEIQTIKSKEASQLPTNQPKPKLDTQGALSKQQTTTQNTEKNKPLKDLVDKVKSKFGNKGGGGYTQNVPGKSQPLKDLVDKVKNKFGNSGGKRYNDTIRKPKK